MFLNGKIPVAGIGTVRADGLLNSGFCNGHRGKCRVSGKNTTNLTLLFNVLALSLIFSQGAWIKTNPQIVHSILQTAI
jgi:hypothetical protein